MQTILTTKFKPVRLPASATRALPRWALLALGLLYILPGLIGRDPWKSDDAISFGIMWTMAHGTLQDWLSPNIAGMQMAAESPLTYWLGALCIKLFGALLGDPLAARVSAGIAFLISALSIWYATYLLGRRSDAQPLKLAFGGQPEARDFGRTLADGAFLIYLGFLGLLLHSHETSPKSMQLALLAFAMYTAVRFFDSGKARNSIAIGLALGLLVITYGWLLPAGILIGLLTLAVIRNRRAILPLLLISLPLAVVPVAAWIFALKTFTPDSAGQIDIWMSWNLYQLNWPSFPALRYLLKYGIWFAWPAWPFAAWAIYAWRHQEKTLHISLTLCFLIPIAALILLNVHSEEEMLLPLLPPLAILAAFGLPTMKRGAINAVDWFSVMIFTFSATFIWIGWIAKETGWPAQIAKNAHKLAPGYQPDFNLISFVIAILGTLCWIVLVNWRISRQPSVLWRAVVLSSGGVILCWLLLTTLWMPWINYGRSYAGVAEQIAQRLPSTVTCIDTNVGPAQRASFAYFGKMQFATDENSGCDVLLLQDAMRDQDDRLLQQFSGKWKLLWEGRRPSDRDERFRLYRRAR
ncbi:glycosyltransferase [Herbaspirillum sp. RTI4]|uniref:ArnT family glycosyltransferase n=1 Tax=Herbaspirillum sp. RTI4 TaxID=3048640 RepID=UPI002AB44313|nr:glycosyltransferase [Herbaspirillum sp. RTI4]MDY7580050.1 glycosyltransferase [Herbaspirillum sp. RTI4]MEA9982967.1 glycosyltransferase [Herbaspirillum sp. RTI4]